VRLKEIFLKKKLFETSPEIDVSYLFPIFTPDILSFGVAWTVRFMSLVDSAIEPNELIVASPIYIGLSMR
jgi:hypothetical protein